MNMARKIYPKEVGINNINQDTGVTAEQLIDYLKQLVYLSKTLFQMYIHLDKTEQIDSISDAVVSIVDKMKAGIVPNKDFHEFKHYLFITFKNSIRKQFANRKSTKNQIIDKSFDFQEVIPEDYMVENPFEEEDSLLPYYKDLIKKGFNMVPPHHQTIITDMLNGKTLSEAAQRCSRNKGYASGIMTAFRRLIRRLYKDPNYKYVSIKRK